jgi:hypothetical protein
MEKPSDGPPVYAPGRSSVERTGSCPYADSPSASFSAHHDTGPSYGGPGTGIAT